jgi:hypothetical protein
VTNANVGRFSVDIIAEEEESGRKVLIENQLEETDHDHPERIITYASGYDAEVIIWIVRGDMLQPDFSGILKVVRCKTLNLKYHEVKLNFISVLFS